ncbi:MAG: CRTAC1 family protein [Planctomycetota bacterium]|nr:CRTAC1 family protein [Planctomycetota bacterium]
MKLKSWFERCLLVGLLLLAAGGGCDTGNSNQGPSGSSVQDSISTKKKPKKLRLDLADLPEQKTGENFRPGLVFQEVQDASGIDFTYQNGQQGQSLMVETTGGGSAWLDYDLDGKWDAYLCQGGDPTKVATAQQPKDVFYRQGAGQRFEEVTPLCEIHEHGYSQGVSAGDFDGDGFGDIYVTNCGRNALWRNLGDGTFEEVTASTGVANGERWSSTSAWADIDLDGDLDLYVCNYVQYDRFNPHPCQDDKGNPAICHPKHVDAWPDALYINQGDGTFIDEANKRGVFGKGNKALGVAIADFNKDGYPDIYVANDTTANFLFINNGKANFEEVASLQGCDVDRAGSFQASMGLGIYDYDENGFLDIFLTHYEEESNTLYQNNGDVGFSDVSAKVRLYAPTLPWLGFGTVMADFNNDSLVDIFVSQGHVNNTPVYEGKQKMVAALFSFDGVAFHELTQTGGDYFERKFIGRGTSCCDFDQDGDWDLMVNHQNDRVSLLKNESKRGHFLKLNFVGTVSNRSGIGTRIVVKTAEKEFFHELVGGTSYASSNEPSLIFGLGDYSGKCTIEIRWPTGRTETIENVAVDQAMIVVENG